MARASLGLLWLPVWSLPYLLYDEDDYLDHEHEFRVMEWQTEIEEKYGKLSYKISGPMKVKTNPEFGDACLCYPVVVTFSL